MYHKIIFFSLIIFTLIQPDKLHSQKTGSKLNNYINKKRDYNADNQNGYSIILYNGNEEEALRVFTKFKEIYKNIYVKLSYISPNWKVITKPYSTRMEAEKIYLKIRDTNADAKIL